LIVTLVTLLTRLVGCLCVHAGHAVFPSLYASMRNKQQFPKLMVAVFAVVLAIYGSMAIMG
jgi:hypothetical protein